MDTLDVPCMGTIVDKTYNSLIRKLRYRLFYKNVVNNLESELKKLKDQKDLMAKSCEAEIDKGKEINDDVLKWREDVEKTITELECFLTGYKQKGSRMRFKDIPSPHRASLKGLVEDETEVIEPDSADEDDSISDTNSQTSGSREEAYGKLSQTQVNEDAEVAVYALIPALRYLFSYKAIVNSLNNQIERLTIVDEYVAKKVDEALNDGKIITEGIVKWQNDVRIIQRAYELLEKIPTRTCFKVFPDPLSRFQVGRKAANLEKNVVELTIVGENLLWLEISYIPPDVYISFSDTPYQHFGSRQEAYGKLWQALTSEDAHPILRIYGMPGVGKTRMMEEAWEQAMDKKIFHKVTKADVGAERIDVIRLQDQLAGHLDCHLQSKDNEVQRASQLKRRLMGGGKTLIILDDVWDSIPLNDIGIPFRDGSFKGCKILLTSRKKDVCLRNSSKDPIEIKTLDIEIKTLDNAEAWEMFKNTVGASRIESLDNVSLAKEVCKNCGALPLLIHAVGKALRYATEILWEDALCQLENGCFEDIDGINPYVYACIKLSFDRLVISAKTLLLICSLFEKDDDIEIRMLIDLATGSQLVDEGSNINELIVELKSSSLLLEGEAYYTVKMNDIIRNVASSIASRDPQYAFRSIVCKSRLFYDADYSDRRLLQLDLRGDDVCFPDNLVCPELHTLLLQCNDHGQQNIGSFFQGLENLRVLVIKRMRLSQHQFSIHSLDKLNALILDGCEVHQTLLMSVSRNLQTLFIRKCRLPSPLDLPELINLRKLRIVRCHDMDHLAQSPEQHDIQRLTFLGNLSIAEISECRGLKFLFSVTAAKCLVQMKELRIYDCSTMEAIVKADGATDGEILTFPRLRLLMLKDLPKLKSFYNDKPTTNSSSLEITEISFFFEKVKFRALEKLVINNIGNEGELWANEVLKQKYDKITTSGTQAD